MCMHVRVLKRPLNLVHGDCLGDAGPGIEVMELKAGPQQLLIQKGNGG